MLSNNSWSIDIDKINKETLDLGVQNPNITEVVDQRTPEEIISEIENLDKESEKLLQNIKKILH